MLESTWVPLRILYTLIHLKYFYNIYNIVIDMMVSGKYIFF